MVAKIKEYFVVDASFILAFLLKEDSWGQKIFEKFTEAEVEFISTSFLKYEIGNGLRSAVLRKRISSCKKIV